jgi:type IV secretory pathway VirB2 component (pilin)
MKDSARRVLLVMMLGATAVTTAGCQAEGYEQFSRMLSEFIGGVVGFVAIIIVILAGIPPV